MATLPLSFRTVILVSALTLCPSAGAAEPQPKEPNDAPAFKPVPLPDPHIPGFQFPEAETTILNWVVDSASVDCNVRRQAEKNINLHAWGLWKALLSDSCQKFEGQKLLVFETWPMPKRIQRLRIWARFNQIKFRPLALEPLIQLDQAGPVDPKGEIRYDPTAAEHIVREGLLHTTILDSLNKELKRDDIPAFPKTAISLKTRWRPLYTDLLTDGRYYPIRVWPGPPPGPVPFPEEDWPTWVWIDVKGGGEGNGKVITGMLERPPKATRQPDVTYSIDKFVHFRIDPSQDIALAPKDLRPGVFVVLEGMHVTTREMALWTWQTFWWVPDADRPAAPSSEAIANDRPCQLKGAERHYAMVPGYAMVLPLQPNTGGENSGTSIYAYNPYLEAKFGGRTNPLKASLPVKQNGKEIKNEVGIRTNCMSCHAMASHAKGDNAEFFRARYSGDRYVDLQDKHLFQGRLKTDFLWSIPICAE
jgi:hypothetical protein